MLPLIQSVVFVNLFHLLESHIGTFAQVIALNFVYEWAPIDSGVCLGCLFGNAFDILLYGGSQYQYP